MFERFNDDEKKSVEISMRKGGTFFMFALQYNATAWVLIAVITFFADANGIWGNWLAITMDKYSKEKYYRWTVLPKKKSSFPGKK